jgi:phosphoenolpyruvate-protein kinase (PTS system EI component)
MRLLDRDKLEANLTKQMQSARFAHQQLVKAMQEAGSESERQALRQRMQDIDYEAQVAEELIHRLDDFEVKM